MIPNYIKITLLSAAVYPLSMALLGMYTEGDQIIYRALYEALNGAELLDLPAILVVYVNSVEPVSGLILWFGSNMGVDKDTYISILNTVLLVNLYAVMKKFNVPPQMIVLVLLNYYVVGLLTAAERLKIAYIILSLSMLSVGWGRIALLVTAPFAHFQIILLYMSLVGWRVMESRKSRVRDGGLLEVGSWSTFNKVIIFGVIILAVVGLYEGVMLKAMRYLERDVSSMDLLSMAMLFVIAIVVFKDKITSVTLAFAPLLVTVALIGGARANMVAVTMFFIVAMFNGKASHPLVYIIMTYFALKSLSFVSNILKYGDGFGLS
jgi:hypothetical protein